MESSRGERARGEDRDGPFEQLPCVRLDVYARLLENRRAMAVVLLIYLPTPKIGVPDVRSS